MTGQHAPGSCDHDSEGCDQCQPFQFAAATDADGLRVYDVSLQLKPAAPPIGYLVLGGPDSSGWFYTRTAADLEVNMARAFGFEHARVAEVRWAY